jgi:hemolysin III
MHANSQISPPNLTAQHSKTSQYSNREEFLNVISHAIGFVVALVGLITMIYRAEGALAVVSVTVYGASLVLMFLSSTLYHGSRNPGLRQQLKLLDHSAIYLLIAGTYTPFMLLSLDNWVGTAGIITIWALAVAGLLFKWFVREKFARVSLALYLIMGWLVIVMIYPLYQSVPIGGLWLLFSGGICFSVGAAFYSAKKIPYTHAIWHLFVIAGCACHFLSIYLYVI